MLWCIVFPTSVISAIFCMGVAYLFKAATVFVLRKVHDVCWGLLTFLCRGELHFLLPGFRRYSVWELPIFLRLRLFFVKKSA